MPRIQSLDLARGFTVLFIPAIHTGMLYSDLSVHSHPLGLFLIAIAEGPGGQLLMLLMGISFTLKEQHSTASVLFKSAGLLTAGYLLNIAKFVIPYILGLLPREVLGKLDITGESTAVWRLLGMGDILHFAALALLVLHGLYKSKQYALRTLVAAIITMMAGPLVWDASLQGVPDYILGFFTGQPPRVFFPLFPWLVYPLAGLFIGYYFRQHQRDTALLSGLTGALLLLTGLLGSYYFPSDNAAGFYRTAPAATCWHLGIVLLVLCIWHIAATRCRDNIFFRLLSYSSKNITLIYIIQWVMICWMLPVFGFRKLDITMSAIVMLLMTLNTYLLTYCFQLIKRHYANKQNL